MLPVLVFFVAHWQISVFFQTFFLHRYGAHQQFTMTKGWERFFYLLTYLSQGSSFLSPRGYAILHRMHHAYSDTEKDPHSPLFFKNVFTMMLSTKKRYDAFAYYRETPEPRFDGHTPSWPLLEKLGQNWMARVAWGGLYTLFYLKFATTPWLFLLLPAHFIMGPIHGAIVNWCGHRYGYRNYESKDVSRNTLIFDFLTAGELFQNNHHEFPMSPNFAARRFELDPTYPVIVLLDKLGAIKIATPQRMRYPRRAEPETEAAVAVAAAAAE